ncbi:unnamed protein product, partial [Brenthis ino]
MVNKVWRGRRNNHPVWTRTQAASVDELAAMRYHWPMALLSVVLHGAKVYDGQKYCRHEEHGAHSQGIE